MPKNIKIRKATDSDDQLWNEYVTRHPHSGPYHLWEWRNTVEKAYKHTPHYLLAEETDSGKLAGGLPLFYLKSPFSRGQLVSLPFCDYGGPIADTDEIRRALCQSAFEEATSQKAYLEIRCNQPLSDTPYFQPFGDKVRMLLQLPENSELLFKKFKSKLRSQIRRPIKDGLYGKIGGGELVEDFYKVFTINMRDLGSPVHSKKWFEHLTSYYDQKARVGVVYKDHIPVASGIILLHNDTVSIPWASSLRSYNRLSPNMLLYWSFLEYAADNGFRRFDFGRSSLGSGTYRFKKQWGAEPHPLFWYTDGDHSQKKSQDRKMRERAENIWMRLPLGLANFMGPRIRKYISL